MCSACEISGVKLVGNGVDGSVHLLKYGKFDNVQLVEPIDWAMDPFKVLNWRHNFLSLRWLIKSVPLETKRAVIVSFYDFHCKARQANDMVGSRIGDHTTSIRIDELLRLRNEFLAADDHPVSALCEEILRADMATLLSEKVYRSGHNHGVMADISLLNAISIIGHPDKSIPKYVVSRGMKSLQSIFDSGGLTQEHSISYQEYNYPVANKFLKAASKFDGLDKNFGNIDLSGATQKLLKFFTRTNDEYIPVGDSFRRPNASIRKLCPEMVPSEEDVVSLGMPNNRLFCENGFFSYVKQADSRRRIHFVSVCAWHSANHKQDDDLSFCLELDGQMIFDDPGYSDQVDKETTNALRNADHHSTVCLDSVQYSNRGRTNGESKFTEWRETDEGFVLAGQQQRMPGVKFSRRFELNNNSLRISDQISTADKSVGEHGFVLAPDIHVRFEGGGVWLYRDYSVLGIIKPDELDGEWVVTRIHYIGSDRHNLAQTLRLAYRAPIKFERKFAFNFSGINF